MAWVHPRARSPVFAGRGSFSPNTHIGDLLIKCLFSSRGKGVGPVCRCDIYARNVRGYQRNVGFMIIIICGVSNFKVLPIIRGKAGRPAVAFLRLGQASGYGC